MTTKLQNTNNSIAKAIIQRLSKLGLTKAHTSALPPEPKESIASRLNKEKDAALSNPNTLANVAQHYMRAF